MLWMHASSVWVRRTFGWMASPQSWLEILSGLALLAGAGALCWWSAALSLGTQVLLWALLVLLAGVLFRHGWLKLFGPVLFYDLVRSTRRGQHMLVRSVYAGLLLLLLFTTWQTRVGRYYGDDYASQARQAADLAQAICLTLFGTQLAVVGLLTPAYVAGAIADEKNRRTLEYLLATDLRSREIVLSKVGARVAQIIQVVLIGLPILSLLQFLGGIDPPLVLSGFAATGLTLFGLAGISIFHSVYYRRPFNAIAISYLTVLAYYVLSFLSLSGRRLASIASPTTFDDYVLNAVISGNLVIAIAEVLDAMGRNQFYTALAEMLGRYALFHGIVGAAGILAAMLRLRPVAQCQVAEPSGGRPRWRPVLWQRASVGQLPMLWKELHVEGSLRFHWVGVLIVVLLVVLSFVPVVFIVLSRNFWSASLWVYLAEEMNVWVRMAGTIVALLLLLAVAVRASACISGERDRQTLDSLLTTPLESSDILAAKWLGNIASVRWGWLWLGSIYGLGLLTGGLELIAVPLLLAAWLVHAGCVSLVGCWFSMASKTTLRATIWTLTTILLLWGGHWAPWLCCIALPPFHLRDHVFEQVILKLQACLTPPLFLPIVSFRYGGFRHNSYYHELVYYSIFGLGFWLAFMLVFWIIVSHRFRRLTNRTSELLPGSYQRWQSPHMNDSFPSSQPTAAPPLWGAVLLEETWHEPRLPRDEEEDQDEGRRDIRDHE
jgi:ABC-type transport system involved in multi-copper enzyme maturation permease subunit